MGNDAVRHYISYDEDGTIKLAVRTTLFGGYDREETCQMVRHLSEHYKKRINCLMNAVAENDREICRLRQSAHSAKRAMG